MSFTVKIDAQAGNANSVIAGVEAGLNKTTRAADQARDAMGRLTASGNAAGAAATNAGNQSAAASAKAAAGHNAAAKAADGQGDSITRLIHLAEAYIAIHQFESIVDGYIEIRNKVNSVTESQQNLAGVMDELFRIAQDTRSEWEGLASTYQRVSNAGRGLGISQREIIDLTEELAMGMRLSGSNSREAMMTMQELTHAFTVGTLTGREFRVMMKDAPALMHELQVVSGKTGAEFAEMGKHGKFTAQTLIEWFSKARDTIKDKFGQTIPTIHEGFTQIRNAAERFFGSAAVGTGVMGALSTAMRFVADHFEGIGKTVLAVGEALLTLFVIEKIIVMVKALTVAIAANPIGLLLTGITVGIALLRQFGDELNTTEKIWSNVDNQFVTVGDHLRALWSMFKDLGRAVIEFTDVAWHGLLTALSGGIDSSGIDISLRNVLLLIASFVDAAIGILKLLKDMTINVFGGIPVVLTELIVHAVRGITTAVQDAVNGIIDAVNKVIEAKNWINEKLTGEKAPVNNQRRNAEVWADQTNKNFGLGPYAPQIGPGLSADAVRQQNLANQRAAIASGARLMGPYLRPEDAPGGAGSGLAANQISHVDLSFKTPYDGAAETLLQKFKNDWNEDIKGTNVTKDLVSTFMDELDKRARDEAAKRAMAVKGEGYVSGVRGTPDAKLVNEKELKELEKLRNELRAIMEQTNPVVAAQEKLAHAQEIVGRAVDKGLISWAQGATAIADYARKLEDALHPHEAWVRKQLDAIGALKNTTEATQDAARAQQYLDYAKEKGIIPTDAQIKQAHALAVAEREHVIAMQAQQAILESINVPQRVYTAGIAAAGQLLRDGSINAEQYGRAIDDIRAAYLAAKPGAKSFADGIEASWIAMKREADDFGVSLAKLVTDDLDKFNEAIVSMANGGKVDFAAMVDSMIQDLERLILKQLEVAAINALISAYTGSSSAGAGAAGSGGGSSVGGGVDAVSSARLSPSAYTAPSTGGTVQPIVVQNHIHNHYDKSVSLAAISGPQGQSAVLNVLRANPGAARKYTGR